MQPEDAVLVAIRAPLPWHEAVAVVRSVADAVATGRIPSVPALDRLALDETGAPRRAAGHTRPQGPSELAAALRTLLGELLDPAAPAPLRALADGTGQPAPGSLEEFIQALAFFERPSRQRDLQSLISRLREQQEQRHLQDEMERLTHKARAEEHAPHTTTPASAGTPRQKAWRSRVMLALGVAIVLIAATVLFAAMRARGNGSSTPSQLRAAAGAVVTTLRQAARALASSDAPTAVVEAPKPASASRRATKQRRVASRPRSIPVQPVASRPVAVFLPSDTEVVQVLVSRGVPDPNDDGRQSPATTDAIYDRSSAEVIPAKLLASQSASVAPQVFIGGTGALEILVGSDGHVEQVRLVATTAERRFYDAMILSAAKSWVFSPANREGVPVRYRVRIPLT